MASPAPLHGTVANGKAGTVAPAGTVANGKAGTVAGTVARLPHSLFITSNSVSSRTVNRLVPAVKFAHLCKDAFSAFSSPFNSAIRHFCSVERAKVTPLLY